MSGSILYIHGFNSAPSSKKACQLVGVMERLGLGEQLRVPALHHHPREAIGQLQQAIAERLGPDRFEGWLALGVQQARLRARFFESGAVVEEQADEQGGSRLFLRLPQIDLDQALRREGLQLADVLPVDAA